MVKLALNEPASVRATLDELGTVSDDADFFRRLMMHLPRVADAGGKIDDEVLAREVHRLVKTDRARKQRKIQRKWSTLPISTDVSNISFGKLAADEASEIFGSLHFLRSYRPDAEYYGLRDAESGRLLSCCGVARSRWEAPRDQLAEQLKINSDDILDLCRMYTLPGSPRNAVSKLLALTVRQIRHSTTAKLLTTVVDPNLGFTGGSYLASNWSLVGLIRHPPFRYYRQSFRTAGQLVDSFGSLDEHVLRRKLRDSYELSECPLMDSQLYGYPIDKLVRSMLRSLRLPVALPAE